MSNVYRNFKVGDIVRAKHNILETSTGFTKLHVKRGAIGIILGRSKNDVFMNILFQNTNSIVEIMPEDQVDMLEIVED